MTERKIQKIYKDQEQKRSRKKKKYTEISKKERKIKSCRRGGTDERLWLMNLIQAVLQTVSSAK